MEPSKGYTFFCRPVCTGEKSCILDEMISQLLILLFKKAVNKYFNTFWNYFRILVFSRLTDFDALVENLCPNWRNQGNCGWIAGY